MKANIVRVFCLVLVLMLSLSVFAGCQKDEPVTKTDVTQTDVTSQAEPIIIELDDEPFEIAKDENGKDVVILTPADDGKVEMTVADGTSLEAFLKLVTAKEGYTICVETADGKEVTDGKTAIANGMVFKVVDDETGKAEIEYAIVVVSEAELEKTVSDAEKQKQDQSNAPFGDFVSTGSKDKSSVAVDPPKTDDVLYGKDIDFGTIWPNYYQNSDALGKAWQERLSIIKKVHDCDTNVISMDSGTITDMIVKEVMAGKASADVYEVPISTSRNAARKMAAANMRKSKTLDWSVYETSATQCVTFGGKSYGVAFDGMGANPMGIFYNKEIVAKYAPDYNIEKLYKEKKWTFEAFAAIAKLCTRDTDGDGVTDIYGLRNNGHLIGMALAANAGGTAVMGSDGRVQAALCSPAGVEALEWCKSLVKEKVWYYTGSGLQQFANGQSAFLATFFHFYSTITTTANFAYGFVPTPIGPQKDDYTCNNYDGRVYMVPKTKEARLDEIGVWLNECANMSSRIVSITMTQMARNGFDATAQGAYRWIVNNMSPEYACFSSDISTACDNSVLVASQDPAKVMESIKSKAQKECDDAYGVLY